MLNALLSAAAEAGVNLQVSQPVVSVRHDAGWIVRTPDFTIKARSVILCTGGLALPKSGSNGSGYPFATRLGHSLVPTTPALSPLLSDRPEHAALSGVTIPVRLRLETPDKTLAEYIGSFLFTHTGYSGPVALNLSRHVARDVWQWPDARVVMRLLPDVDDENAPRLWDRLYRESGRKTVVNALADRLPRRVAEMVAATARVPVSVPLGQLGSPQRSALLRALLESPLPVRSVAGYAKAEATAGGIALDDIEPASMMSRRMPGFFFAGEVLDVDGWLGGYNFQWAWSSGAVAGRAAARWVKTHPTAG